MHQSIPYIFIALLIIVGAYCLPLLKRREQMANCVLEDFFRGKFPGIQRVQALKSSSEMKDSHGVTYDYTMIAMFEITGLKIKQIVEACVEFYKSNGRTIPEPPRAHPKEPADQVFIYDLRTRLPKGLLVYQIVYNPHSGKLVIHEAAT